MYLLSSGGTRGFGLCAEGTISFVAVDCRSRFGYSGVDVVGPKTVDERIIDVDDFRVDYLLPCRISAIINARKI